MSTAAQRTDDWARSRYGRITASRFADLMTNGRGGQPSKTAQTYIDELVCEHLTGRSANTVKTFAMEWGIEHEPIARREYERCSNVVVQEVGYRPHRGFRFVGGSCDGLVGDDGIIEIKCPLTYPAHLRVVESGEMPEEHTAQVQGYLWIWDRQWCDFISYHEHFPESLQLVIVRVDRDETYISELANRVAAAERLLIERLNGIVRRFRKG